MKLFALVLNAFSAGINLGFSVLLSIVGAPTVLVVVGYVCFCISTACGYKLYGELNEKAKEISK